MNAEMILELTSADIPGVMDAILNSGIEVTQLTVINELTVRFRVRREDHEQVLLIAEKRGETVKRILRLGVYWKMRALVSHWVLLTGLLGILLLTAWLPTRVLFVQVEGNTKVSTGLILDRAAQCGILFGADRGAVRSEQVKNALLDALPQLQWAGINTSGCVAVITVEERTPGPEQTNPTPGNIVAVRDGIISELTAHRGSAAVKVGQAVRAGEVLISGYTDLGGVILFPGAQGEVYGRTIRTVSSVTMDVRQQKVANTDVRTKISLVIGKKRINFYKDSGILDTGCVKMYSEYYLTLPGGLSLPVKLILETEIHCQWEEETVEQEAAGQLLADQTAAYLESRMIAGQILSADGFTEGFNYYAEYVCREMIGRLVHEEIIQDYGENRRTNGECRTG